MVIDVKATDGQRNVTIRTPLQVSDDNHIWLSSQLTFTCSKSTIGRIEKLVKYVQS